MSFPSALALSPQGHVYVESHPSDERSRQESPEGDVLAPLHLAFGRGTSAGLLALGAMDPARVSSPTWSYWRDFSHQFISRLCALIASGEAVDLTHVSPPPAFFEAFASAAPPMTGAEYLSPAVLSGLWTALNQTLLQDAAVLGGEGVDVPAYLATLNPAWQLVGRVCFHLAELRDRADTPFAFLATYVQQISSRGRAQHVRLGVAVQQAAETRDRERLLTLLAPVERAAAEQPFIKSLVESGAVYETLAWTPREAHHFLRAVPALEAAGVTVRVPDWWTPRHPPRVQVQVSVGGKRPSQLGQDALLDFSVRLALDGEPLSAADWTALRRHADGLAFVKGRWVEIDHAKLAAVLAHWKGVQRAAAQGGLSFSEGLHLLAGASVEGDVRDGEEEQGPEVAAWSHVDAGPWLGKTLRQLRTPETIMALDDSAGLAAVLRPYQRVGIQWLTLLHALQLGGCLADDMGLGKTIQMLGCWTAIQRRSPGARHLLVVPASLLGNWQAEVARFAPSLRLVVVHPSATPRATLATFSGATLPQADVVITTYGAVHRLPWLAEITWETIVLDEAQAIKNPGTRQARAVKALRSRARFALTGTPIENRLGDLWSLFDFFAPGLLGSARGFSRAVKRLERRSEPHGDAPQASLAYAPLRGLVHPYILRRLKTDPQVIGDLPDKTELRAFCSLTPVQAALYQSSVESLTAELHTRDGIARRGLILAFLTRVKQICNHPSHWLGDGRYDPSDSGKFSRLRELCETIATRQEKVLVFTQFRELTEPLADFLAGVFSRSGFVLHGGTPVRRRAALVDAFQREDGPPFFVLSLKAGGTGLTLTAASHVVHFDRWWNPAVESQATDRAYRIGQHRNVLVHKFLCRGTVEERIDALIDSKLALSRELLETSGDRLLTELGDDELISLVTLNLTRAVQETE